MAWRLSARSKLDYSSGKVNDRGQCYTPINGQFEETVSQSYIYTHIYLVDDRGLEMHQ